MSTASVKAGSGASVDAALLARTLNEGYGPGAWHGPDLKAALADVPDSLAFWRPAPGRHNIAEIALHHAYYVRSVRARLTGTEAEPFPYEGDDWFSVPGTGATPSWSEIGRLVAGEYERLAAAVRDIGGGSLRAALPPDECFGTVLGLTCHAVYHAGQIQLIRRLHG